MRNRDKRIWIDLDNSPHVPFFRPIIEELRGKGFPLTLTARDAFQVSDLAKLYGVPCRAIGRHYGKNMFMKGLGLAIRSAQLLPMAVQAKPDLAVSHGSRAQMMVAKLLDIPSVVIADYEHAQHVIHPDWAIVPEVIPGEEVSTLAKSILNFPGIKEDVYVPYFQPDPTILPELGVTQSEVIVTVRPPATEAHYHNPESEKLFSAVMNRLGNAEGTRTVLLPRNQRQKAEIMRLWPGWLESKRIIIPRQAVEGLNLIWHSDVVISGGGTMNREAAALNVPVYSIFRGKMGAVDRYLVRDGRLVMLETVDDVQREMRLEKKRDLGEPGLNNRAALHAIVNGILSALQGARDIENS